MYQSVTEKFVFISRDGDDVTKIFGQKVFGFHEEYLDELLLSGLGDPDDCMSSLKMQKNPEFDDKYFQELVSSLQSVQPLFISTLIHDSEIDSYLSVFYITDEELEGFYLLQQIHDWCDTGDTSYQVWSISKESNLYEMLDYWSLSFDVF